MAHQERIEIAGGVETSYGVGGETSNNLLPSYSTHRVNVVSGALDVDYLDVKARSGDTPTPITTGKTSATQDEYTLSGVGQFILTATGATVVIITSD